MAESKIPANQRIDFYNFIRTFLEADKGLQESCEEVSRFIDHKAEQWGSLKPIVAKKGQLYAEVAQGLRRGRTLARILQGRIPDSEVMMLVAGGQGKMIEALKAAAKEAENRKQMVGTLVKGIIYPSVVFLALIGLMYYLGVKLFPPFESLVPASEWPGYAQIIYWLTTHIHIWVPLLAVVLAGISGLVYVVHTKVMGQLREILHWFPPFNVIRAMTGANLLSTTANLLVAGGTLQGSLERIKKNSTSPYMQHYVNKVLTSARSGDTRQGPGAAFQIELFRLWTQVELEVYGRGTMDEFAENIEAIAETARSGAQKTVSMLSMVINFLMLGCAAFLMISVILVMNSITQTVMSAT